MIMVNILVAIMVLWYYMAIGNVALTALKS